MDKPPKRVRRAPAANEFGRSKNFEFVERQLTAPKSDVD
jgi:hypothetical protein